MKSFFIRHTEEMLVHNEDINKLWDEDRIAIHFPGKGEKDLESIKIEDYESDQAAKIAIKYFNELINDGGYILAEYHTQSEVKIGRIKQCSFKPWYTTWREDWEKGKTKRKKGDTAILKTLQMENVRKIKPEEAIFLMQRRPRQGTIREWRNIETQNILEFLVEKKPIDKVWNVLSTGQQETVCAEYLRNPDINKCPELEHLLLPIGRTLKDVDICGYSIDKRKIFAQVTNYEINNPNCKQKIEVLKKKYKDAYRVFFCRCNEVDKKDDILFIPIERVFQWLRKNEAYFKALFASFSCLSS